MSGLATQTLEVKEDGCGRILLPNATGLQDGDEASPMEGGMRTVVPCTRAGMGNGTMQAVIRNIPSFVKSVLMLQNCAQLKPSSSSIKDFDMSLSRTR